MRCTGPCATRDLSQPSSGRLSLLLSLSLSLSLSLVLPPALPLTLSLSLSLSSAFSFSLSPSLARSLLLAPSPAPSLSLAPLLSLSLALSLSLSLSPALALASSLSLRLAPPLSHTLSLALSPSLSRYLRNGRTPKGASVFFYPYFSRRRASCVCRPLCSRAARHLARRRRTASLLWFSNARSRPLMTSQSCAAAPMRIFCRSGRCLPGSSRRPAITNTGGCGSCCSPR